MRTSRLSRWFLWRATSIDVVVAMKYEELATVTTVLNHGEVLAVSRMTGHCARWLCDQWLGLIAGGGGGKWVSR